MRGLNGSNVCAFVSNLPCNFWGSWFCLLAITDNGSKCHSIIRIIIYTTCRICFQARLMHYGLTLERCFQSHRKKMHADCHSNDRWLSSSWLLVVCGLIAQSALRTTCRRTKRVLLLVFVFRDNGFIFLNIAFSSYFVLAKYYTVPNWTACLRRVQVEAKTVKCGTTVPIKVHKRFLCETPKRRFCLMTHVAWVVVRSFCRCNEVSGTTNISKAGWPRITELYIYIPNGFHCNQTGNYINGCFQSEVVAKKNGLRQLGGKFLGNYWTHGHEIFFRVISNNMAHTCAEYDIASFFQSAAKCKLNTA